MWSPKDGIIVNLLLSVVQYDWVSPRAACKEYGNDSNSTPDMMLQYRNNCMKYFDSVIWHYLKRSIKEKSLVETQIYEIINK